MIVIRKYDKNGKSEKIQFGRKLAALLWLCDNIEKSEWCWIMYQNKEGVDKNA